MNNDTNETKEVYETVDIFKEETPEELPKKKGHKGLIVLLIVVVLLAAAAGVFFRVGNKFKSVSVEAGTEQIAIDDFLTWSLYKPFSSFVSADVDLNKVGTYNVRLSMAGKEETVSLRVIDTVAPEVEFKDHIAGTGYEVNADDFVVSVNDLSGTKAEITSTPPDTSKYGLSKVKVTVHDDSGNEASDTRDLLISWLKDEATVEVGSENVAEQLVYHPESESRNVTQDILGRIDVMTPGDYTVETDMYGTPLKSTIHVADTTAPVLEIKNVTVYFESTDPVTIDDFIESVSDNSGKYDTRLLTQIAQSGKISQDIIIRAEDPSGNFVEKTAKYVRGEDMEPPVFSGLESITVEKNSDPDLEVGVVASDVVDGEVEFTVDTEGLDLSKAGTYYITYTAEDKSGNSASETRAIVVQHDEEDTKELVKKIAEMCGNDFQAMREMVQNITYVTAEYGGDDPVWVGFTTWRGNCYVHALCYKALLDYYGYENQIIHCNDLADGPYYSHYWNLVFTTRDGVEGWWHTDGTPGPLHGPTPTLASDAERYATLQNGYENLYVRDWNRDEWPASPEI